MINWALSASNKTATPGAYVSVEHLLQLRYLAKDLSLETRKKSSAISDGDSHTNYRGRGMEFAEVRPYQPGDDVRNIDWRVTARTTQAYTKLFQEERERPVLIVVDQRSPMFFGSKTVFKSVAAAQMAAAIGWIALQSNDRIGALIYGDNSQVDLRAKRGKHATLSLINQLQKFNANISSPIAPSETSASSETIFSDLRRVAKPGSAVFIISDFHDFDTNCIEPLSMIARHADVSLLKINDPLEQMLPNTNDLALSNNHDRITIRANNTPFLNAYQNDYAASHAQLRQGCINSGAQLLTLNIAVPIEQLVQEVFRNKRGGRHQ